MHLDDVETTPTNDDRIGHEIALCTTGWLLPPVLTRT
jgi:hypothetical protein